MNSGGAGVPSAKSRETHLPAYRVGISTHAPRTVRAGSFRSRGNGRARPSSDLSAGDLGDASAVIPTVRLINIGIAF